MLAVTVKLNKQILYRLIPLIRWIFSYFSIFWWIKQNYVVYARWGILYSYLVHQHVSTEITISIQFFKILNTFLNLNSMSQIWIQMTQRAYDILGSAKGVLSVKPYLKPPCFLINNFQNQQRGSR